MHPCRCTRLIRWSLAYCFDCNKRLKARRRIKGEFPAYERKAA